MTPHSPTVGHMDQTTYFSFRCASCSGRSRVASRHAGQVIVCPHCQAHGVAVPDMRPSTVPPRPATAQGAQVTTSRVARPLTSSTTTTIRRTVDANAASATATATRIDTGDLFGDERPAPTSTRQAAPGMAGFADNRAPAPVTGSIRRTQPGTTTIARTSVTERVPGRLPDVPRPVPQSSTPFIAAMSAAIALAVLAAWAGLEANANHKRYEQARNEAKQTADQAAEAQATSETLDKRLASAQVELAAAKAAFTHEHALVVDLQKAVSRLSDDLAKASRIDAPGISTVPTAAAVHAMTNGGAFPSASLPTAGVPNTRRDNPEPAVRTSK